MQTNQTSVFRQGMEEEKPSPSKNGSDNDDCSSSTAYSADNQASKQDAMAYLLRYETMVRQQEAEDMAVMAHLRPCVQRLLELLGQESSVLDHKQFLQSEISFEQLKLAYDILLQQQNDEFMTTDRQFMMVLQLLTQKVDLKQTELNAAVPYITWAEILQCYKVCVSGMVSLQHSTPGVVRSRTRDRTLAMLSLFEPPSTQLFHQDATSTGNTPLSFSSSYFTRRMIPRASRKRDRMYAIIGAMVVLCMAVLFGRYFQLTSTTDGSRVLMKGYLHDEPKPSPLAVVSKPATTQLEGIAQVEVPIPRKPIKFAEKQTNNKALAALPVLASTVSGTNNLGTLRAIVKHTFLAPKRLFNLVKHFVSWIARKAIEANKQNQDVAWDL